MKRLIVYKFALLQSVLFGLIGLLLGVLYSFGGLIIDVGVSLEWFVSDETPGLSLGTLLAFGALIGMPLIGIIFGFLVGLVQAFLFNSIKPFIGKWDFKVFSDHHHDS